MDNRTISRDRLLRMNKATLADMVLDREDALEKQRKIWSGSESGTPVYDSIAHLDPREKA